MMRQLYEVTMKLRPARTGDRSWFGFGAEMQTITLSVWADSEAAALLSANKAKPNYQGQTVRLCDIDPAPSMAGMGDLGGL
jgi:hypothetical protein